MNYTLFVTSMCKIINFYLKNKVILFISQRKKFVRYLYYGISFQNK